MTFLAIIGFSAYSGDFLCALHFYVGMMLAYITLTFPELSPSFWPGKVVTEKLPIPLVILALLFASYTDNGNVGDTGWSRVLAEWGGSIFPSECIFFLVIFN